MGELKYFIYSNIAGCHPSWTVAVLAVSHTDATRRINGPMWRGGKFQCAAESGTVDASCGDVTDAAQAVIHEKLEEEYQYVKRVEAKLRAILGREPTCQETMMSL